MTNYLAIDYGQKNVGLAFSVNGVISPLKAIKNDDILIKKIISLIDTLCIEKVYVGLSHDRFGKQTKDFYIKLTNMLKLPVESIDESVSTIEASQIFLDNKKRKKNYKKEIDSISACVILRRALG